MNIHNIQVHGKIENFPKYSFFDYRKTFVGTQKEYELTVFELKGSTAFCYLYLSRGLKLRQILIIWTLYVVFQFYPYRIISEKVNDLS